MVEKKEDVIFEKISIIVPAYNIEKYIGKCLESLLQQTYPNLEIIVVDDGSKDNTLQVIQEYAKKDNRIKVIEQENQGVSEARNEAMKHVTANYVMFVDGDDWLDFETCEVIMREMQIENPDIVWFAYQREYEKRSLKKGAFEEEYLVFNEERIRKEIYRRLFGPYEEAELAHPEKLDVLSPVWGKLYKREVIQGIEFQSLKEIGATGEDIFFNMDVLAQVKKITYIKKYFYHYRKENPNSLTKKIDKTLWKKYRNAYEMKKNNIIQKGLKEDFQIALNNHLAIDLIALGMKIQNSSNTKKEKLELLREILRDDIYQKAVKSLNITAMPLYWKFFYTCAKIKNEKCVYMLLKMICFLASRK